jgi:hypothetical protein
MFPVRRRWPLPPFSSSVAGGRAILGAPGSTARLKGRPRAPRSRARHLLPSAPVRRRRARAVR